jgi:hypothetical protein
MDYFKSSSTSFGVSNSFRAVKEPPRSSTSAHPPQFTAAASPPREVVSRTSFGGGFYQPKKESMELPSQDYEFSAKFPRQEQIEEPRALGLGIIDSLEHELLRLKRESYLIREQKASKPVRESLLHLDPHSHRQVEGKRPEDMLLSELELMRSRHAAKLAELETEYLIQKKEPRRQPRNASKGEDLGLDDHWRGSDYRADNQDFAQRPPLASKQTFISKYEAKFDRYLSEKLRQKRGREVKGSEVWEPTVQEREEDKTEMRILVKYMFNKLDTDLSGKIDRLELLNEVHSNPELAELFNLKALVTDEGYIEKFNEIYDRVTDQSDSITLPELYQFFKLDELAKRKPAHTQPVESRTAVKHSPRKEVVESELRREETVCLLQPKHLQLLESLYNFADENYDLVVSRRKLYDTYFQDERIIKLLAVDAVKIGENQALSLETMLEFILQDGDGVEELITWKQFLDSFYVKPDLIESDKGTSDPRLEEIELPQEYLQIVQDLFDSMPRHTRDKISTYKFLETLRKDPQVKGFLSLRARETHKLSEYPGESLSELLDRIEEQADALITWHEVVGYFSRRGKPLLEEAKKDRRNDPTIELRAKSKPVKEAFVQTTETQQSPQKAKANPKKEKLTRHNRSFDQFDYLSFDQRNPDLGARSLTPRGKNYNITIPKPFAFDQRELGKKKTIRQQKVAEMVQEKELELLSHIHYKYRAKAVPAEVAIPRYEGIKASQEARRYEVRRTSKARTKDSEKPFNFYLRDLNKEKPKPPVMPTYEFKAKSVPWEVSIPLYDKMITEEKVAREERIARAAQETLSKAKLPPRMEMHSSSKSQLAAPKSQSQTSSFRAKDPPNFMKLQKMFKDTLDAKKEARKPTEQKPFNFTEVVRKEKSVVEPPPWEKLKPAGKTNTSVAKSTEPAIVPKTTKKMLDMAKMKQEQKAKEEARKEAEAKADEDRKQRLDSMKPRVQSSNVVVDKSQSLKDKRDSAARATKQKFKEQEEEYARNKEVMMARVSNRPLLVEQASSQVSKHNSRMMALMKMKDSLVQEGVNPRPYLNEDEKDEIEDAEYLAGR